MNNCFDRIVVVNLKRRADRLANFNKELEKINWPFVTPTVFEAVDGNIVPVPALFEQGGGAWGCLRSHLRILETAIMDKVGHLLVLEDDACFISTFNKDVETFLNNVPKDYDGLMLGGQHINTPRKVSEGVVRCVNCQRTHAYSVRGKYMRDLYAKWASGIKVHCDWVMGPFMKDYKVYAPDPFLIGQDRSKSDINGAVNPRKMWVAPSSDAPVIHFVGPRQVFEDMREYGWHGGYDRNKETGIDNGLINLFQSSDPRRKLKDWITTLQWEATSMETAIVVVWHPQATEELIRAAWGGPVYEIKAETVTEALKQMPTSHTKYIIPSKHFLVVLKCPREIANDLTGHGFHRGYWIDPVSNIDNGLRQIFHEGATPYKLGEWINALTPEAEAIKGVVTVWHPDATVELLQQATDLKVVEISGDSISECLDQWRIAKGSLEIE